MTTGFFASIILRATSACVFAMLPTYITSISSSFNNSSYDPYALGILCADANFSADDIDLAAIAATYNRDI